MLARVDAGVVHSQTAVVGLELAGTHQLDPLHQRDLAFDALGQRHLLEIAVGVGLQHALVELEKLRRTPPQDVFKEDLIKNARSAHFGVVLLNIGGDREESVKPGAALNFSTAYNSLTEKSENGTGATRTTHRHLLHTHHP